MPSPAKHLTSEQNPLIKDVRRANLRGSLTETGYCLAEGFHLLGEALRSPVEIGSVIAAASAHQEVQGPLAAHPEVSLVTVPDSLFDHLSSTETAQGVLTLVRLPEWTPAQLFAGPGLVVLLDALQDPGNVGTIARAAEAFGANGLLLLRGTAAAHHPKTLRAAAGSLFRLPLVSGVSATEALALSAEHGRPLLAAAAQAPQEVTQVDLTKPAVLAIGNEGQGVQEPLAQQAQGIRIATQQVESLNAAVSAAVILYEAQRQRHGAA